MIKIEYNKRINAENRATFTKHGCERDSDYIYKCVICESPTCISDSFSNRGDHLICEVCYRTRFANSKEAFLWIDGQKVENTELLKKTIRGGYK